MEEKERIEKEAILKRQIEANEVLERHITVRGIIISGNFSSVSIRYEQAFNAINEVLSAKQSRITELEEALAIEKHDGRYSELTNKILELEEENKKLRELSESFDGVLESRTPKEYEIAVNKYHNLKAKNNE